MGRRGFWVGVAVGVAAAAVSTRLWRYSHRTENKRRALPPVELLEEQLVRNRQFWGKERQEKIQKSYVIIVGLGGVGSHCAVALARAGVQQLRLIDFDRVTLSSLNRHACAELADVGWTKADLLKRHILKINPRISVDSRNQLFRLEEAESLLLCGGAKPDFIVDCIDNLPTKIDLIKFCVDRKIPLLSSGGAGGKCDPTKVRIDALADVTDDDLARAVRNRLRALNVSTRALKFIYNCERGGRGLLPLQEHQKNAAEEFRPLENFRVRIVPVVGMMPAIFGQAAACHVVTCLAGEKIKSSSAELAAREKITLQNYKGLFESVMQKCKADGEKLKYLTFEETKELYAQKWEGRSAISGKALGPRALQLVPWRKLRNGGVAESFEKQNLVSMSQKEAQRHLNSFENSSEIYDKNLLQFIDKILEDK